MRRCRLVPEAMMPVGEWVARYGAFWQRRRNGLAAHFSGEPTDESTRVALPVTVAFGITPDAFVSRGEQSTDGGATFRLAGQMSLTRRLPAARPKRERTEGAWSWTTRRLGTAVITGVHAIVFAHDAERARAFFRDTLGFDSVDVGGGWLIFALPPAELAAHPTDERAHHELYLMCDDVHATVADLKRKGVEFTSEIAEERWGLTTAFEIPGGGQMALYEPRHPRPNAPPG